jgi:asparagine synthase (glutamine-hydrolysing)
MCGFTCFINENFYSNKYAQLIKKKLVPLHRGPDVQKFYSDEIFSSFFKRLSIIDLTQNSNQPLMSDDKRFVMVFNGEIYNFIELKKKLIQKKIKFNSKGDAEVLLKYFITFGEKFIDDVRGMFSFCIWDRRKRKLIAYRDRFGQKPLYFFKTTNGLILSSEIKDLKQILNLSKNNLIIKKYLYRNILDTKHETFYKNLKRLGASEKLTYEKKKLNISKYYNLKILDYKSYDKEEFLHNFKENLKLHLKSDVKIAYLLSGGIDSSSIVATSKLFKENIKAFSILPKKTFNEKPWISDFIKKKKINHEIISVEDKINLDGFKKVLYYQDEPFHGMNCVYQFFLNQEIKRQKFKVLLTGEGADEIFGGYDRMYLVYMAYLLQNEKIKQFNKIANFRKENIQNLKYRINKFFKLTKNKSTDFENNLAFNYMNSSKLKDLRALYNLKWNNLKNTNGNIFKNSLKNSIFTNDLQLALRMSDRNSMSASIENRSPFLDHKFVEYIFSIKTENFFLNNLSKGMLRDSMREINTTKILNRIKKTGRPGSDSFFLYNHVFKYFLENILNSDLDDFGFNKKKIFNSLNKNYKDVNRHSLNKDINNNNNFFFRIFSYLIWSKIR